MKLALCVLPFALLLSACGPSEETQAKLQKAAALSDSLRTELSRAEEKLAVSEAALAKLTVSTNREIKELKQENQILKEALAQLQPVAGAKAVEDTRYIVLRKQITPGKLTATGTKANPNQLERTPAVYEIFFKGVQSGKEYPAFEVQEPDYSLFKEGESYSRDELARAKK